MIFFKKSRLKESFLNYWKQRFFFKSNRFQTSQTLSTFDASETLQRRDFLKLILGMMSLCIFFSPLKILAAMIRIKIKRKSLKTRRISSPKKKLLGKPTPRRKISSMNSKKTCKIQTCTPAIIVASRNLEIYNLRTGQLEKFDIKAYKHDPKSRPQLQKRFNFIMRDGRTGEIHPMDIQLLETLQHLHLKFSTRQPFHLISGFRSQRTNQMLRKTTSGVARNSRHTVGQAMDIAHPHVSTQQLAKAASALCLRHGHGGVGKYTQFVHIDSRRGKCAFW